MKMTKPQLALLIMIWQIIGEPNEDGCFVPEECDDLDSYEGCFVSYVELEEVCQEKGWSQAKILANVRTLRKLEDKGYVIGIFTQNSILMGSDPHSAALTVAAFRELVKAGLIIGTSK